MAGTLRVAMIGYGFMGAAHSQAWRTAPRVFDLPRDVEMAVIVGRNQEAVADAAAKWGWQESATDWRDIVTRDDIDIVDIVTPGHSHHEIAIAALKAGKHVLCEKPLANSGEDADAMAEAARESSAKAMLGFTYRRVPALAHARDLVAAGRLGEIRQVRASYLQDWLVDAEAGMSWRLRKETAGSGALGDIGSHAVDQIQFVTGQSVTAVRGRLATMVPERPGEDGPEPVTVDDAAWASLELSGGAIASLEASRMATGRKNELSLEVYGTEGALRFDLERLDELWFLDATVPTAEQGFTRIVVTEPEHPYLEGWWPQGHVLGWENAFTNQARDLLLAVADRDTAAFSPDFEDGLALQRVLEAIIDSDTADGATVRL